MRARIIAGISLAVGGIALALAWAQAPKTGDDEQAIRKQGESYSAAFNKADLEGLMAHWAADADYIDEDGKAYKGKEAISALFKKTFVELKAHKLRFQPTSIRVLKGEVALEDGKTEMTSPDGSVSTGRYTAVWTRTDGKWLLSSARDLPNDTPTEAASPLKPLEWLVGDWGYEDKGMKVNLTCRWALNRSFLTQEYVVQPAGGDAFTVVQWVGWDPQAEAPRSWIFDSRAGYSHGEWTRQGNLWTAQMQGVIADGKVGTSTTTYKFVDENNFQWKSLDRELDSQPLADVEVKFTRKTAK